ncbi:MAG: hypothetical protein JNK73_04035 [Bacteroidia bacterium]|nr:hypothetical protein [Bacteroidia bacterium]
MGTLFRIFIMAVLVGQFSCTNQGQSEKNSETLSPDSRQSSKPSDQLPVENRIDTVFIALQGDWKMTRKYSPSGKTIQTDDAIIITVRDSLVLKSVGNKIIWADTLFRHFYHDSISEFYPKTENRSGLLFDERHPKKLTLLYGKGDLGGEDYLKIE